MVNRPSCINKSTMSFYNDSKNKMLIIKVKYCLTMIKI